MFNEEYDFDFNDLADLLHSPHGNSVVCEVPENERWFTSFTQFWRGLTGAIIFGGLITTIAKAIGLGNRLATLEPTPPRFIDIDMAKSMNLVKERSDGSSSSSRQSTIDDVLYEIRAQNAVNEERDGLLYAMHQQQEEMMEQMHRLQAQQTQMLHNQHEMQGYYNR
ncbi:hypothetical protein A2U01_0019328, partial [Trifolium medium]|nr:hypothetical protein [Trifolium medium]